MKVMAEPMELLINETLERAIEHASSMLGIIRLSFADSELFALDFARTSGRTIDPVASCYFSEAQRLLFSTCPDYARALVALDIAAEAEPECYGKTYLGLRALVLTSSREAVEAELRATLDSHSLTLSP